METLMPTKKTDAAKAETKPKKDTLTCMVLKAGADRISTGERKNNSDVYYARQDQFEAEPSIAKALQARGLVEIMDD
jgi:hypothetical protein